MYNELFLSSHDFYRTQLSQKIISFSQIFNIQTTFVPSRSTCFFLGKAMQKILTHASKSLLPHVENSYQSWKNQSQNVTFSGIFYNFLSTFQNCGWKSIYDKNLDFANFLVTSSTQLFWCQSSQLILRKNLVVFQHGFIWPQGFKSGSRLGIRQISRNERTNEQGKRRFFPRFSKLIFWSRIAIFQGKSFTLV